MAKLSIDTTKAIENVTALVKQLEAMERAVTGISDVSKSSFDTLKNRVAALETQLQKTNTGLQGLTNQIEKNTKSTTKSKGAYADLSNETKKAQKTFRDLAVQQGRNSEATKKAEAEYRRLKNEMQKVNATAKKQQKGFLGLGKGLGRLIGALGFAGLAMAIGNTLKSMITLTIKFQSLGYALEKISGNVIENIDSMGFLMELNDKFGAKLSDTTERWLKFRAAAKNSGVTLMETQKIFRSVTKASSVLGLRTDELRGIYLALEQMLSKGKVTTEELRRQLGERLPGAMGIMADALGVSISQLDKMMKKGEILSAVALPRFAEALEEAYGITALETVDNLATSVGKMSGAWDRFVLTVSEGDSAITKIIGGTMSLITLGINSLTNFLETYQQTARRTSGDRFGKEVSELISGRIEDRLEEAGTLEVTEERLKGLLKIQQMITNNTKEGSDQRERALIAEGKAQAELTKLQERKAKEGNIMGRQGIADEKELLKSLGDRLDAYKEIRELAGISEGAYNPVIQAKAGKELTDEQKVQLEIANSMWDITENAYTKQLEIVKQYNKLGEVGKPQNLEPTTTSGSKGGQIKLAKEFNETNQLRIIQLKEQIRLQEELRGKDFTSFTRRRNNLETLIWLQKELADEELISAQQGINTAADNKILSYKQKETKFTGVGQEDKLKAQQEQTALAIIAINKERDEKLLAAKEKFENKIIQIEEGNRDEKIAIQEKDLQDQITLLKAATEEKIAAQQEVINATAKGSDAERKEQRKLAEIKAEAFNEEVELRAKINDLKLQEQGLSKEEIAGIKAVSEGIRKTKVDVDALSRSIYEGKDAWKAWASDASDALGEVGDLVEALFERQIAGIDEQISKTEEYYDRQLELAKNDDAETKIIERNKALRLKELQKEKIKVKRKEAKFEKAIAINQAIINTALGVSRAFADYSAPFSFIIAAITGALGAVQIATIAARPLPTYATGGVSPRDEMALINDGGNREYVERDGQILSTSQKNAIVELKSGDVIHKDYEEMARKSALFNGYLGGDQADEDKLDMFFNGIEGAIGKGFKKAKLSPRISVLNSVNSYREEMQNWN